MSLSGRLEDLQLRDLLQILGLSRNSGLLELRYGKNQAELLFSDGLVVSAWQQGAKNSDPVQPSHLEDIALLRHHMIPLVQELMHWDDGDFSFKAAPVAEILQHAVCGKHVCLDSGLSLDDLLSEESVALPVSDSAPEELALTENQISVIESPTVVPEDKHAAVLLVDDDPQISVRLVRALAREGLYARSFSTGRDLLNAARPAWKEDRPLLIIIDLIMPRLHGGGILGGLELVEQIRSLHADQLCLVYSDYPCPEVEQRLQQSGITDLLSKPMSQSSAYADNAAATTEFCDAVAKKSAALLRDSVPVVEEHSPDETILAPFPADSASAAESMTEVHSAGMGVLKGMLQELQAVESGEQVMLLVLRFASEVLGRAVLFSVGKDHILGLGQFGYGNAEVSADEKVRKIRLPLADPSTFKEILEQPMVVCGCLGDGYWDTYLRQELGLSSSCEVFIGPLVSDGRVVAFLCGDNQNTRQGIDDSYALEIFLQQAGIVLENLKMRGQFRNLSDLLGKTVDW